MGRPDPIEYAERLYGAIRAANFSPLSFLAFGNAVKDGVSMRNMPRIAVEPFMRVVGDMLDMEDETADGAIIEAAISAEPSKEDSIAGKTGSSAEAGGDVPSHSAPDVATSDVSTAIAPAASERRRGKR